MTAYGWDLSKGDGANGLGTWKPIKTVR
jgi:hypothetical protein